MAEVRCQMCGESVSDELDNCPFCQARLIPMNISSPGNDEYIHTGEEPVVEDTSQQGIHYSSEPSPMEEETIQPRETTGKKKTSEMKLSLTTWLQKLGVQPKDKNRDEEQVEQKESLDEDQDIPEPAKINGNLEITEDELPFNPIEEDIDWLSGLEQTDQEEAEHLSSLSSIKDTAEKNQSSFDLNDEKQPKVEGDWLDSLRGESSVKELEPQQGLDEPSNEGLVFDDGIPDWMKKLQSEVDSKSTGSQTDDEILFEEGNEVLPDWLNRLQAETQSNAVSNEDTTSGKVAETPDWLDKMSGEVPVTSEEISSSGSESPDWFRNLESETQAFAEDNPSTETEPRALDESQTSDSESPDRLKELMDAPRDPGEEGKSGSELPDWLKEIDPEAPVLVADGVLPASETPDWDQMMGSELQDTTEADSEADEIGELADNQSYQPLSESEFMDELIPVDSGSPLVTETNSESELIEENADEPLMPDDDQQHTDSELIPDWLANIDKTETASSGSPDQISEEQFSGIESETTLPDELLPAEIPSWVQDMRPVESMVAEVGRSDKILDQITEKVGPLAGLPGVLPATPGLGKLRKPLNYSSKLRLSDDQNLQADQLEQMLGVETLAKTTTAMDKRLPQKILRWLVASLVFLVVAYPIFTTRLIIPPPLIYPPELMATHEILVGLPPASPVLLIFDYEPAYSGELEVTAAPMVDNLLFNDAYLVILSTSPTGSTLAEHFLKTTQSQHNNQSGLQYTNLGYLAGGASGVLSFVENPSQTIPKAIDASLPWQTPLLQDIHTLADFRAVIILTDNSDTARIWIEQTNGKLGETPLLMAISAQAEPMIRPYYDSKQINGLVTGLAGGKAYEQALQLSGLGQKYWDSFGSGFFIAEVIIFLGALWSIVSIQKNRKSLRKEEA